MGGARIGISLVLLAVGTIASLSLAQPGPALEADDGVEMVLIPAGEFWMGSPPEEISRVIDECRKQGRDEAICKLWFEREGPRHRVYLDAFYIDRDEVTTARFEKFVRVTGYRTTAEREGSAPVFKDDKWSTAEGANWRQPGGPDTTAASDHPVVQVSWYDAEAYCNWASKRLPTEAEWEKAARGTDGRRYPWGDDWDETRVGEWKNHHAHSVGSAPRGASPYGVLDMAGNVWEWVADWHDGKYYRRSPERNPRGPDSGQYRGVRGGSWNSDPLILRSSYRGNSSPGYRSSSFGFRCSRAAGS
jgi:formylglycine-generating enzyme required for sulfatase activity